MERHFGSMAIIQMCCFHSTASREAMASTLPLVLLVLCSLSMAQTQLKLYKLRATDLPADLFGISDAYVKVFCGATSLGQTSIQHNEINPWWNEEFHYNAWENDIVRLEVYDSDSFFDDRLGVCETRLRFGTYDNSCTLEEGGTLHYIYSLS